MERRSFLVAGLGLISTLATGPVMGAPRLHIGTPTLSLPSAINKAGRQRMLSQRCSKAWLMLMAGVLPADAKRILQQSTERFEAQLAELFTLQPSGEVSDALRTQSEAWEQLRPLLQSAPEQNLAKELFTRNEALLQAAHRTTLAYEQASATPIGRLINIAGRQRMLSQRMAKFYYFRKVNVEAQASSEALKTAAEEFGTALKQLSQAPQNTARLNAELGLVEQQWFFFQQAVNNAIGFADAKGAANVATTSERLLEQLDLVVSEYEALAQA